MMRNHKFEIDINSLKVKPKMKSLQQCSSEISPMYQKSLSNTQKTQKERVKQKEQD